MSDVMLYDSQTAFSGGMQAGFDPAQVAESQYYRGINIACREGRADVRPSFEKRALDTSKLVLSTADYNLAEADYNEAVAALAPLEALATQAETDYLTSLTETDINTIILSARALPLIIALEAFYGIELTEFNVYTFLWYITVYNNSGTAMLQQGITVPREIGIWGYLDVSVWIKTNEDYTDTELSGFVWWIYFWRFEGTQTRYENYVAPFLNSTSIVTADADAENALTEATAAWAALKAIINPADFIEIEYNEWQAALSDVANQQAIIDEKLFAWSILIDYALAFQSGRFQGAAAYSTSNRKYICTVISGHIYLINLISNEVTCLTNYSTRLNPLVDVCYFCQVEDLLIIQDGIGQAKILQGASLREADPEEAEIPRGTNMAYGHGRLAIQVSSRSLILGDIYLSYDPESVLKTKENQIISLGGEFTVATVLGNIISLQFANVSDTSTGDGPLLAICENGFSTFAINNPRAIWNDIAMQKVQLIGSGIVGSRASCNIHEDIMYRSYDGIRSYAVGVSEASSARKYTEISKEVEPYMQTDMHYDAKFLSMAYFDKRMLALTSPQGMKARTEGYQIEEENYVLARDNALLLEWPTVPTDENIQSLYEESLDIVFNTAVTWITKDEALYPQADVDAQVASIALDPADKYARIEKLILWADSAELVGTELSDAATLKAYDTAVVILQNTYLDDVYFKGIIAFDFSLAGYTTSTQESQYKRVTTGSYDGIWTGIRATQIMSLIIEGEKKCFAMAKNAQGDNVLYEITRKQNGYDNNRSKKIESMIEFRSMPYKAEQTYVPAPFIYKHLEDVTLWLSAIEDDVNLEVFVSSDVINAFTKVGELALKAKTTDPLVPSAIGAPQSRAMIPLWDIQDDLYDATTKHPIRLGNEFMFRLIWTGKMGLRRFFTAARKQEQDPQNNLETTAITYPIDTFDQYRYSSD